METLALCEASRYGRLSRLMTGYAEGLMQLLNLKIGLERRNGVVTRLWQSMPSICSYATPNR